MLADLARYRYLLATAVVIPVAMAIFFATGGRERLSIPWGSRPADIEPFGTDSLGKMRASLDQDRKLLAAAEREQSALRAEVIRQRKLLHAGGSAGEKVAEAEQAFVASLRRVHALRDAVTETDIAITEAILGEKVLRLPVLPVGGFSKTAELTRFNGPVRWSIREASRVEKFFAEKFGRRLPITALGQSETHSRLGFDHRDAMDVGLHPESNEGRALIDYLRKTGIPFLAFNGAVPGAATGPHIHIGRPSGRLVR
jgi:hypothetical protein